MLILKIYFQNATDPFGKIAFSDFFVCFFPRPWGKGDFSRTRILSDVRRHVFLWAFLATWGCARDFLEMLPKFKMAARGQL